MIYTVELTIQCSDIEQDDGADHEYIAGIVSQVARDGAIGAVKHRNPTCVHLATEFTVRKSYKT